MFTNGQNKVVNAAISEIISDMKSEQRMSWEPTLIQRDIWATKEA